MTVADAQIKAIAPVNQSQQVHDYEPSLGNFAAEVAAGLGRGTHHKTLPCKFFYDQRGSQLFDRICELPEYYPTRTELAIMQAHAGQMVRRIGPGATLVEYGSGSSLKTRVLLDHLDDLAAYVPIDISRTHLLQAARGLRAAYPRLAVEPVCADYTTEFRLPVGHGVANGVANGAGRGAGQGEAPNVVAYFPGSTIGNFDPEPAAAFLRSIARRCGRGSGLLIGVDLKKDPAVLHAAYNDSARVTAEFNLNILRRINTELGGDVDLSAFAHHASYNPRLGRMEMHLVSLRPQQLHIGQATYDFEQGESIHTENSHKHTLPGFAELAKSVGYAVEQVWTDERGWFGVQFLRATA